MNTATRPEPLAYDACRAVPSSAIPTVGVPPPVATVTGSEKVSDSPSVSPSVQVPSDAVASPTDVTTGPATAVALPAASTSTASTAARLRRSPDCAPPAASHTV